MSIPEYMVDADRSTWIPLPLEFPFGRFESREVWARELGITLATTFQIEDPMGPEILTKVALDRVTLSPVSESVVERYWYFPEIGGFEDRVVELSTFPAPITTVQDLEEVASFGVEGPVQTFDELHDTEFDVAATALLVLESEGMPLPLQRFLGLFDGALFVLDLFEPSFVALNITRDAAEELFRSIRLRRGSPDLGGRERA